jgi:hypothetical protein
MLTEGMETLQSFVIGEGATICMWSDRHAGTIVGASPSRKSVTWQQDTATRTDTHGMSEDQSYSYERDENGRKIIFTLRSNGKWVQRGQSMHTGTRLVPGRHKFHDYSF